MDDREGVDVCRGEALCGEQRGLATSRESKFREDGGQGAALSLRG